MTDVVSLSGGRVAVPDNRWDLAERAEISATVSVIVPYYNQPEQLDLVLAGIAAQTYPAELLDVVVADDGSTQVPDVARWAERLSIRVVSQQDNGFRAAAARNLGAQSSHGDILCFLDADTVPEPDYVRRAVKLPSVVPDALVVGRREHADLSGVTANELVRWFDSRKNAVSTQPRWLADAYERTSDLRNPGWDGYKFVLSAVMTCTRELFAAVGGFDESFVRYGGEDWEFAHRAFMMGAVFAHDTKAVAWHDGPDWGARDVGDRTSAKNAEAIALSPLITDPKARTLGLRYRVPDCVALVDTTGHTPASLITTIASVLGDNDCAVWLVGADSESFHDLLGVEDSRVRRGGPDAYILSRCRYVVATAGRVVFGHDTLRRLADELGPGAAGKVTVDDGVVTMTSSRAVHRARRWSSRSGRSEDTLMQRLFGVRQLSRGAANVAVSKEEPWLAW